MTKGLSLNHLKFGIPILILLLLVMLSRTSLFQNAPEQLSVGILLDLLITIPIVFFLLIRKTRIPKFTVIYPFVVGLIVAGFIIPIEHQQLLSKVKLIAIPVIEIGIVSLIIYKIRSLSSSFKKTNEDDFYNKLLIACHEVFPNRIGKVLATEIGVVYYLFAPNKKRDTDKLEFTYFKKSGIKSVIGVLLFLVIIETIAVHILVSQWNVAVAWVLSFIGTYTMIQILSVLRSMNKRLIRINHETECLELRYGFGSQTSIPFKSIDRIEKNRRSLSNDESNVCLSVFDMLDTNNTIIYLNKENTLHKIYGIEKQYKSISLFVDEIDLFIDTIDPLVMESKI